MTLVRPVPARVVKPEWAARVVSPLRDVLTESERRATKKARVSLLLVRVYLVGAGVVARTHVEASRKLPEPIEVRVADTHPDALAGFLQAYRGVPSFASAEEMLASESPCDDDIVIVATPPFAHVTPTLLALRSGRHVLSEKPLATSTDQAEEMLRVAEHYGRLLGDCSVRFKGTPHTEAVKRLLRSGVLGEPYHVTFVNKQQRGRPGIEYQPSSRWFLDSAYSGGGVLMDWGPYDVATLTDVFQPSEIEVAGAWVAQPRTGADPDDVPFDVETHVGAVLTLSRGDGCRPVTVHYERASGTHGEDYARVEVEGTAGSVSWAPFDSQQPVQVRHDLDGRVVQEQIDTGPQAEYTVFDRPLLHFYRRVRGLDSLANVGARAVDHFRCLQALYRCAGTGERQVVAVHSEQRGSA